MFMLHVNEILNNNNTNNNNNNYKPISPFPEIVPELFRFHTLNRQSAAAILSNKNIRYRNHACIIVNVT